MSDPDGEWGIFALAGGGIFLGFASFGGAAWEVGFHVADCMINKRPVTWQGVGISALKGAVTGVAFGVL